MEYGKIIKHLESLASPANLEGMARFGITARKAYGISNTELKKFAREIGKSHQLVVGRLAGGITARAVAVDHKSPHFLYRSRNIQAK